MQYQVISADCHLDIGWLPAELFVEHAPAEMYATYQHDEIGIRLLDLIGEDHVMWGSDFPHPDGIWPDSLRFIDKQLSHLPATTRRRILCENAANVYGFDLN